MSFPLLLVILIILSGTLVLIDKILWSKKRPEATKKPKIVEYARDFFPIFLIVLLLRSFLVEAFRIPSGSLEPTLEIGDFVAVNKFTYGLHLPVLETRILPISHPKTGDIVVFRWPPGPSFDYIKRVIGVPGDVVSYHNKKLTINGKEMPQQFVEYTVDESSGKAVARYTENLNGIIHDIYIDPKDSPVDFDVTVPNGHYFVLGDNRDASADSRFWGYLPEENLRGRAFFVWMSWNNKKHTIRWENIGHILK